MSDARIGENARVDRDAVIGYEYEDGCAPPVIGANAVIRSGSRIYGDVRIGDDFVTGHDVLVREHTTIGDDVIVGTNTVLDGEITVGSRVSLQTGVYVPTGTEIGSDVFVGPCAVLTNDAYPIRTAAELDGPTLEDHVSVGANATVLPGVTIGEGSFVAAGAIVTEDVPPRTLAVGAPAERRPLPEQLQGGNQIT
jgi:acetyltransferase-like isoleucine patch superfamily enzyme